MQAVLWQNSLDIRTVCMLHHPLAQSFKQAELFLNLYLTSHRDKLIIFLCRKCHYRFNLSLRNVMAARRSLHVCYKVANL